MPTEGLVQKVSVPEGRSGDWSVERFDISQDEASQFNLRAAFQFGAGRGGPLRRVTADTYTRLMHNRTMVMSDTPADGQDHLVPVLKARVLGGHVLLHGLGLGMVLNAICNLGTCSHITVVEIAPEVIDLVGKHCLDKWGAGLVTILQDDALTWQPPKDAKYSVVWHDIWSAISDDNLRSMRRLHRRFGNRCIWQGSWARDILENYIRLYGPSF